MNKRVITGFIVAFVALASMLLGGVFLAAMLFVIACWGTKEYTSILRNKGFLPSFKIILFSSVLFTLMVFFDRSDLLPVVLVISSILAFMWVLFRGKQPYIANVATTILGFIYCGWFPFHLLVLRNLGDKGDSVLAYPEGACYCVLLLISVLVTDTFCYFVGCKYGKHKLAPVISPNKTIEGAAGGTIACLIATFIVGSFIGLAWYHCLILGFLIALFAQIGDLCESMIKRDAGVKDSSNALPGHGGFLDRTDSYIFVIPVLYYYVVYFIHTNIFIDIFRSLF